MRTTQAHCVGMIIGMIVAGAITGTTPFAAGGCFAAFIILVLDLMRGDE